MSSHFEITYYDGRVSGACIATPTHVSVNDCREREAGEPFIGIHICDEGTTFCTYAPVEIARDLYKQLGKVFGEEDAKEVNEPVAIARFVGGPQ